MAFTPGLVGKSPVGISSVKCVTYGDPTSSICKKTSTGYEIETGYVGIVLLQGPRGVQGTVLL